MLAACFRGGCFDTSTTSGPMDWTILGMLIAILLAFVGGVLVGKAVEREQHNRGENFRKWWDEHVDWPKRPGGGGNTIKSGPLRTDWADADRARQDALRANAMREAFNKTWYD